VYWKHGKNHRTLYWFILIPLWIESQTKNPSILIRYSIPQQKKAHGITAQVENA